MVRWSFIYLHALVSVSLEGIPLLLFLEGGNAAVPSPFLWSLLKSPLRSLAGWRLSGREIFTVQGLSCTCQGRVLILAAS